MTKPTILLTGAESSFNNIAGTPFSASGDNSRLTSSAAVSAAYAATAKIRITATFRYSRRSLSNDQIVAGVPVQSIDGKESLKTLSLGADYEPARSWQVGCNAVRELRLSDSILSSNYAVTTANCSAQFTLK